MNAALVIITLSLPLQTVAPTQTIKPPPLKLDQLVIMPQIGVNVGSKPN